jgi:succinate-semialdehyde dehydrogenase/glutarate-semialdehyde dehydrogenase
VASTLQREAGKTRADAAGELGRAVAHLRWNGEQAARITGTIYPGVTAGSRRQSIPVPLGVVAAITAWNFPAVLTTRKLGAILAAGCTPVLKASEAAPETAAAVVQALTDAGAPVNLVFGDPAMVSGRLLDSPHVKALSFTGSTAVGKLLAAHAGRNLVRTVLELGGHAPVVVCQGADVGRVIATTAPAKFGSAGQSCVAPTRYIVHESLAEAVAGGLIETAGTQVMGAVADQGRVDALLRLTEDAVAKGAQLLTGGYALDRPGFFFAPTVLADVPAGAAILEEEPFGPIATVNSFSTLDEAIALANASPYSFAAYVFTDSLAERNRLASALNASNIGINQTAPSLPDVPMGGLGNSGYGYEGGADGILAFTQLRLVSES